MKNVIYVDFKTLVDENRRDTVALQAYRRQAQRRRESEFSVTMTQALQAVERMGTI